MGFLDSIGDFFSSVGHTIHDDIKGLFNGVEHIIIHSEDKATELISGEQKLVGNIVHEGATLVDNTVKNTEQLVGNIGGKAIDSVKGILTSPVLLIGGAAALLLLMKM